MPANAADLVVAPKLVGETDRDARPYAGAAYSGKPQAKHLAQKVVRNPIHEIGTATTQKQEDAARAISMPAGLPRAKSNSP